MSDTSETEFKLRATHPLEVASVDAILREIGVPCRASSSNAHTDTYLDDENGSLAAAGIGLRLRVSGGGQVLTSKVRGRADDGLFVRQETTADWADAAPPATAQALPPGLRDRIEPFVLDRALLPVLQLVTHRDIRALASEDQDLCELTIDRVEATAGGHAVTFQEVELEVVDDLEATRKLVETLLQRLPLQAATEDKPTHAATSLGLRPAATASQPGDGDTSIAEAVTQLTQRHLDALHRAEVDVRADRDPEHLHTMRVAVRRLRSVVRAFRDLWPHDVASDLLDRLADIGRHLGALRDLDVMLAGLAVECPQLPELLRAPAEQTMAWIGTRQAETNEVMQAWLRNGDRLRAQRELERTLGSIDRTTTMAAAPAADAVRTRVAHAAARLRRAIAAIPPELPFEPLHALRIASKRLRYVAEEFDRLPGHDYGKALGKIAALQQALGAVCDHDLAARRLLDWLRPAVEASADGSLTAAALGGLAARHAAAAAKARKRVAAMLADVDRKRVWRRFGGDDRSDANLAN